MLGSQPLPCSPGSALSPLEWHCRRMGLPRAGPVQRESGGPLCTNNFKMQQILKPSVGSVHQLRCMPLKPVLCGDLTSFSPQDASGNCFHTHVSSPGSNL